MGYSANAYGDGSVALGESAAAIASSAIALGQNARTTFSGSIALGSNAKTNNSSSIAVGSRAAAVEDSSIAIGYQAQANERYSLAVGASASSGAYGSTALGHQAVVTAVNTIQLGNASNLSALCCLKALTVTSDERDKTDIQDIGGAVDFLKRVRAFSYVRNDRDLYNKPVEEWSEEERDAADKYGFKPYRQEDHAAGTLKRKRRRVGVGAQTVQQALIETFGTADYADIVNDNLHDFPPEEVPDWVESHLGVTYEKFIPFLIKAVQELDARLLEVEAAHA